VSNRLLTAFCALLACAHPAPSGPEQAQAPVSAAPAKEEASAGAEAEAESAAPAGQQARAEATALRIMAEVAAARSLPIIGEVSIRVMDRGAIRDFARAAMYEHNTPARLRLIGRIEASLGVLPRGSDAEKVLLDLLEEAVMGIYDPKSRSLMIGSHVTDGMLSMVVGHEIAHGLQDMSFGLLKYQTPMDGHSDAETARTFLIEGDAQAAYLAWVSGPGGLAAIGDEVLAAMGDQTLDLAGVMPQPILTRMLQMPYTDGAATVVKIARERGWAAVDALYSDLPTTSEQMLHPEKLLAREPARAVRVDAGPLLARLPGYQVVWEDDLGEASLLAMLAEVEKSKVARRGAAGWGGDRYVVLERAGDDALGRLPITVGLTVWDSAGDAAEFEASFARYMAKQTGPRGVIERRGDRVIFATQAPDEATRRTIAGAAWSAFAVDGAGSGSPTKERG
jgi:hypothetical protein